MAAGGDRGPVLSFLRGEHGFLESYDLRKWLDFCRGLAAQGLLICHVPTLSELAPRPVVRQLLEAQRVHRASMQRRLDALARLAEAAREEHLRFAVIKGMAASLELYGDALARQSGDVDVLVAADDLPKADYVARKAGWVQPAEGFRARRALNQGRPASVALRGTQAPYPLRSNPFLPHVTNYFYVHSNGQVESLEVHDRFHGLTAAQAAVLLANPRRITLGKQRYATPARPAQALLSLLSLHEDAEGVRANTAPAGDLGLKACVDVLRWLEVLDEAELAEVGELARSLGCERTVAAGLGVCCALFPGSEQRARLVACPLPSVWPLSYEERLLNPGDAHMSGVRRALSAVCRALAQGEHAAAACADGSWHHLPARGCSASSGFSFRVHRGEDVMLLSWRAPAALAHPEGDVAFQVVLILAVPASAPAAVRVDASCVDGTWRSTLEHVGVGTVDAHVGPARVGVDLPVAAMPDGDGGLKVEAALDATLLPNGEPWALPSAHLRNYASLFTLCAGWMLADVAEGVLGA